MKTGHICIYLHEGEIHCDLVPNEECDGSLEQFAQATADATYNLIMDFYKELLNGNIGQPSIQ